MPKRKQKLQLKVVLETNAIWSESERYLLPRAISELVTNNRGDAHLSIEWLLPEVVLRERRYQMQREAAKLLPGLARLESVIGHPLNITQEVIDNRIQESVARQVSDHQLVISPASYDRIDWPRVVEDAVNRRAPFEKKSEKGFRDALIAETFIQIVENSPEQAQRCRIVLLTGDILLAESLNSRLSGRNNVQILSSVDELIGLINTLISTVPEEYVARLQQKATSYFLKDPAAKEGIFYDLKVREMISSQRSRELATVPEGADRRSNGQWRISVPRFVKKEGQRVFWASRISIEAEAYKQAEQKSLTYEGAMIGRAIGGAATVPYSALSARMNDNATLSSPYISGASPYFSGASFPNFGGSNVIGTGVLHNPYVLLGTDTLLATGQTIIEVNWSVSVNVNGLLSKPKVESIEFVEPVWKKTV